MDGMEIFTVFLLFLSIGWIGWSLTNQRPKRELIPPISIMIAAIFFAGISIGSHIPAKKEPAKIDITDTIRAKKIEIRINTDRLINKWESIAHDLIATAPVGLHNNVRAMRVSQQEVEAINLMNKRGMPYSIEVTNDVNKYNLDSYDVSVSNHYFFNKDSWSGYEQLVIVRF